MPANSEREGDRGLQRIKDDDSTLRHSVARQSLRHDGDEVGPAENRRNKGETRYRERDAGRHIAMVLRFESHGFYPDAASDATILQEAVTLTGLQADQMHNRVREGEDLLNSHRLLRQRMVGANKENIRFV